MLVVIGVWTQDTCCPPTNCH